MSDRDHHQDGYRHSRDDDSWDQFHQPRADHGSRDNYRGGRHQNFHPYKYAGQSKNPSHYKRPAEITPQNDKSKGRKERVEPAAPKKIRIHSSSSEDDVKNEVKVSTTKETPTKKAPDDILKKLKQSEAKVAEKEVSITKIKEELLAKNAENENQKDEINSKNEEITSQAKELKSKTKEVARLTIEINTVKKQKEKKGTVEALDNVKAKCKKLEESKENLQETIKDLMNQLNDKN